MSLRLFLSILPLVNNFNSFSPLLLCPYLPHLHPLSSSSCHPRFLLFQSKLFDIFVEFQKTSPLIILTLLFHKHKQAIRLFPLNNFYAFNFLSILFSIYFLLLFFSFVLTNVTLTHFTF